MEDERALGGRRERKGGSGKWSTRELELRIDMYCVRCCVSICEVVYQPSLYEDLIDGHARGIDLPEEWTDEGMERPEGWRSRLLIAGCQGWLQEV